MHVLHVISNLDRRYGGPATALAGLARSQTTSGLQVAIATTWRHGHETELAQALTDDGVQVERIGPCRGPLSWSPDITPTLRRMIGEADIVHIHTLFESVQHAAARISRERRIPYIMRPCGMLDPWSLAQKRLKKKLYLAWRLKKNLDHAAAIHYTTNAERDLAAVLGIKAPAIVVPNGVDLNEFAQLPPRSAFRRHHPSIGDRKIVLFLGRLHAKKGFDMLIPAFAKLQNTDAVLVIAGPDAEGYGARLNEMIDAHGLRERVLIIGMITGADKIAALRDGDLFVLPSYQENFGIAVVEALAAGLPVIVSDRVNIQDEITAAGVGEVVPLNSDALAATLAKWLGDDELRRAAAERAAPFARHHYDWNNIARSWIGHYESLIAGYSLTDNPARPT